MKSSVWSEEKSLRALRLWADGLTASEIAEALGENVTRNSVLAHFWRLRRMLGSVHAPETRKRDNSSRKREKKPGLPKHMRRIAPAAPLPEPEFIGPANALPDEGACRFIRGDLTGEWQCCGQAALPQSPWCAHHRARVYQAVKRSGAFYYRAFAITRDVDDEAQSGLSE